MARARKKLREAPVLPWLITYCDLMTLLLAFFVLLLGMSVIDERAKMAAISSVSRSFGFEPTVFNPLAGENAPAGSMLEPGAMKGNPNDLAPLRDMLLEDADKDLEFKENKYVQIFSISDDVLFEPGGYTLSATGMEKLGRILPYLQRIQYPLLVAGHTTELRDEIKTGYIVKKDDFSMDSSWHISYRRALAVYSYLVDSGISPERLSLEAFGQFHPRYSNSAPEGRQKNRRVDLVLDRRNLEWINKVEALREEESVDTKTYYKGFKFDLELRGPNLGESDQAAPQ